MIHGTESHFASWTIFSLYYEKIMISVLEQDYPEFMRMMDRKFGIDGNTTTAAIWKNGAFYVSIGNGDLSEIVNESFVLSINSVFEQDQQRVIVGSRGWIFGMQLVFSTYFMFSCLSKFSQTLSYNRYNEPVTDYHGCVGDHSGFVHLFDRYSIR